MHRFYNFVSTIVEVKYTGVHLVGQAFMKDTKTVTLRL